MNFKKIGSHLLFTTGERNGILLLSTVLVGLIVFNQYRDRPLDSDSNRGFVVDTILQRQIDSLKMVKAKEAVPKQFPFNPNFISDYKAYMLGMDTVEHSRLTDFRGRGLWVNSASEFQAVTGISDSLLNSMEHLFKFPEWVNRQPEKKVKRKFYDSELSYSQKRDLNTTTADQLEEVYGIGPALSKRIVSFRDKLGGFSEEGQLYGVYGLKDSVIIRLLKLYTVKTPVTIQKMELSTASASDIATIPSVSFEMARKIWEYNRLREGEVVLQDLEKIEGMTPQKLRLISVYLSTAEN